MLQGGGGVITIYSHVLRARRVQYAVLPIRESVLHLTEIAEYWSRGLSRERTQPEIYAELLDDFWHGELAAVHVHDHHPIDRESVLKAINSTRNLEHPGFTLIESPESIPPKVKQHQDGSVTIDQGLYIVLPLDVTDWTDEIVRTAYDRFAKLSLDDFHDWVKPLIYGLGATRDAFAAYCDLMSWDRPRFWFGKDRANKWTVRRQRDAEVWLKQIASEPKRKGKSAYFVDAKRKFPALSRKNFDQIWNRVVPGNWKRSGPVVRCPPV